MIRSIFTHRINIKVSKIQDLKKIIEGVSQKVGYNVLELLGQDEIADASEYPINNRKVVVFNDIVNAPANVQNKITNHYRDERHHKNSPIYQKFIYTNLSQKLTLNCSHMLLYPPATQKHFGSYCKRKFDRSKSLFKAWPL